MSTRLPGAKYGRVFDTGRVLKSRLFTAWVLRGADAGRQAGVVVSKKSFRHAVDRNRAKRILREGFRQVVSDIPGAFDCVLVGRSALRGLGTADVVTELMRLLGGGERRN